MRPMTDAGTERWVATYLVELKIIDEKHAYIHESTQLTKHSAHGPENELTKKGLSGM